jgi:hypothetical protein
MGISRFGSRLSIVFLSLLIAVTMAASAVAQTAPLGDVYSSGGGAANNNSGFGNQIRGVIISITPVGINRVDVKLQDPVTGYIHSVTVEADVVQGLKVGERVTQYQDPDTGEQMIAPTILQQPGQSVPGQTQETGTGQPPVDTGNNGGTPPPNPVPVVPTYPPAGPPDNGGVPLYPGGPPNNGITTNPGGVPTAPRPPRKGGIGDGGGVPTIPPPSAPYYPEPKMVGNYIGSGVVNGIPVDIGGPNATPIPAGARPGTPVTVNNQTGVGPWKQFRGTLQSGGSGYYVQFNQGLYQGYDSYGRPMNGWFPLNPPQSVSVHAG